MTAAGTRFLAVGLFALTVAVFSYTQADPDLWGHVLFGRDTAQSGGVTRVDPYSFTSDRPWINHEWLSEVAIYEAWNLGASTGLVVLKALLLLVMMAAILSGRTAVAPEGLALAVGVVVVGTLPQAVHVRPQLFSLSLFALLLRTLTAGWGAAGRNRPRDGLMVFAIMSAWANLHGGWILGVGSLFLWVAISCCQRRPTPERVWLMAASAAATAATLINPYGWTLWRFLFDTVGLGRDRITDWQPVYRMGGSFVVLWAALSAVSLFAIWRAVKANAADPRALALVLVIGIAAFWVNRLMAFFAISLTVGFGHWVADLAGGTSPAGDRSHAQSRAAGLAAIGLALTMVLASAGVLYQNASCVRVIASQVPDPQTTMALAASGASGRLLTTFDWGQYAIWFLSPRLQVSIDGRRETVYSDELVTRQFRLLNDPLANRSVLDELRPDYAWLPRTAALVPFLEANGWIRSFSHGQAVVLARQSLAPLAAPDSAPVWRCFPGP